MFCWTTRERAEQPEDRGINVVGTLGILISAEEKGLTKLNEAIDDLKNTNFRASPKLLESLLEKEP